MNILLIGSGGREHALAWKLAMSPLCDTLFAAPGNPGIAEHATLVGLDVRDHATTTAFCTTNAIELVVIGPEAPLVDGLGDSLRAAGFAVFGPDKAAAQLEGSKAFTKALCDAAHIPTARYVHVKTLDEGLASLGGFLLPVVVKADGLAAGKGVTVAATLGEAEAALGDLFAEPGGEAVIEEFLDGEEASLFVLTDGTAILPFGSAQDHKRVGEGDSGPNTGGMGAYSPARVLTPELEARALDEIVAPTVAAMAAAGTPFSGVLYAGLMLTADGPKLIEYNARFGDPECQVLMMRLESDLVPILLAVAQGTLAEHGGAQWRDAVALTVVLAANGYPGMPEAGGAIDGIADAELTGTIVFQAGTRQTESGIVASGGRVLAVTALGETIGAARDAAYRGVDAIDFPTGFCRRDIGWREIARADDRA
ncbi:phosphoribosylamine--glycine ligase [Sphingomonas sp. CARO-RG-8B-R24-01]|uniref:phosphoribosylamine--glycine ligase n=1 Tax=Sphingomonas sp. CARO-RG-8B-R24-01 TaxID=2914831 RepID=UPI001F59CCA8|nr:phosphoribosylamine--glycine ligase [Sphingomonas sp. CARO-RG-8B-R24-01]